MEGSAVFLSLTAAEGNNGPTLCHLDRSEAQWRDLCVDALSWECFSSLLKVPRQSKLDGNRLHFRILLQSIFTQLAPHSRLLVSSEWRPRIQYMVAIYPDSPRSHTIRDWRGPF